jgi:hypothetical protein
MVWHKANRP